MTTGMPSGYLTLSTHTRLGGLVTCTIRFENVIDQDWPFIRSLINLFLRYQDPHG